MRGAAPGAIRAFTTVIGCAALEKLLPPLPEQLSSRWMGAAAHTCALHASESRHHARTRALLRRRGLTTAINAVQILDGRATAKAIRAELGAEVASIQNARGTPGLGVLLVGDRRDSLTHVRMKRKAADEVGFLV